jgi:hypothetical protein
MNDLKRKRGAPSGNRNACKHGRYSTAMDPDKEHTLKQIYGLDEIDQYIRDVRAKLETLLKTETEKSTTVCYAVASLYDLLSLRRKLLNNYRRTIFIMNFAAVISKTELSRSDSPPPVQTPNPEPVNRN